MKFLITFLTWLAGGLLLTWVVVAAFDTVALR